MYFLFSSFQDNNPGLRNIYYTSLTLPFDAEGFSITPGNHMRKAGCLPTTVFSLISSF